MDKQLEQQVKDLEQRVAALEGQVQAQQEEFSEALAFLFDRSEYKELIKQKKLKYPKILTKALKKYLNI
ncbi:hypothetical protein [Clostridium coskatii]|uniref:Uncharacterized protein n=1 Tax=Clostridium coskatii TaxID=1705578 RepID=A0A162L506_9CLOT|nr:hypothetical protein [Clostridium coskatii]OAA84448.1 hypothetical protein WX73_03480 [Clostridium coskatii]OBR94078.1 hypothetical protein CLCOS_20440 [Clostridium coskatii]